MRVLLLPPILLPRNFDSTAWISRRKQQMAVVRECQLSSSGLLVMVVVMVVLTVGVDEKKRRKRRGKG